MLNRRRRRLAAVLPLALSSAVLAVPWTAPAVAAENTDPQVVAADGTAQAIHAIDPSSRTAGMFALYTPAFGDTTKTNEHGGEAVLEKTDSPGSYRVLDVCTAFEACPNPGNNAIPDNRAVLSASPGGDADVRIFLRDHVRSGDVIQLENLTTRSVSTTIDAVDPTAANNPPGVDPATGKCYPGCRGAEQLVIYTPAGDRATTGTNDFGYEVTVVGDRVVSRGGNNRAIPADGFVISGHGGRGEWLSTNAVLGARVTREGGTLRVVVDASTYIYRAEQALDRAEAGISAADESCLDAPLESAREAVDEAEELLAQARAAADAGDTERSVALAERARARADVGWYRTAESRPVEGRGIWVRPIETTPQAIHATLDKLEASGVNMIFLETVWQGYTIFPSDVARRYGIAEQRPNMVGFDPLQVWIDGARERGMELHPWVHTFFVGTESGGGPVLTAHPEWAAVEREDVGKAGPQPSSQEPGYYFIDPAIPEVRRYVSEVFEEILTDYDVEGLHLDYIRYPVSQPWQTAAFSYSDYSRAAFEADHGVDPLELTPADPRWQTWNAWREENVTSFVADVRQMQRRVAPDAQMSAAVFPDPSDGLAKKFQNWADWVRKDYVDVLTGMSFGTSGESVARDTTAMRETVGEQSLLYTATYGPFRGSDPETVIDQVQSVRDAGSDGAALFAHNHVTADQATSLAEGVFRTPARVPHADLSRSALEGSRYVGQQVVGAAGECLTGETAGQVRRDLATADLNLRADRYGAAAEAFASASERIEQAGTTVQDDFSDRTRRDLAMFRRWSERLQAGR